MVLVDAIILLMLGLGAVIGFKRGVIKQTVISVGFILVIVLAFILKNPLSTYMYEKLPFFNFDGIFAGVTSLNIIIYEMIAFLVVASVLMIIFRIIVGISTIIERILDFTIFLGIPSRILGAVMGIIEAYVWIFIILYFLTLPVFNIALVNESKYKNTILNKTPIISTYADKTVTAFNEIYSLKDEFKDATDSNELNLRVIDVLLKNKVVSVLSVEKLQATGKLKISGLTEVLDKYR
jgi:uncharacterized membrane protein required for colicin V production